MQEKPRKSRGRKTIVSLMCITFFAAISTRPIRALESALTAAPAIVESVLTPGQPTQLTVEITNNSSVPLPLKGQVSSFAANEQLSATDRQRFDASSWFKTEPTDFILQPYATQTVTLTVTAPVGAEPGGHYATVFITPLLPRSAVSPQTAAGLARIGILTFLLVPGDIQQGLKLHKPSAPVWQTFGPVNLEIPVENTGNTHLSPTGSVRVTNLINQEIALLPLDPGIILPGTTKAVTTVWESGIKSGLFRFTIEIKTEGETNIHEQIGTQTWLIPWPIALILILVLTLLYKICIVNGTRVKEAWRVLRERPVNKE